MDKKNFDFDEIISRRGTDSLKWDLSSDADVLPLWVADMDFKTAPSITEALTERVRHGIFGYVKVPDSYYEAVINWFKRRHGWLMQKEWILYTSGVVPAISAIIKAMTQPGDKVLVQTPVYNCFFSSIKNNGCQIVSNPLTYHDGTYHINFDDLEAKAADDKVKVLLLCNPHNPAGRVWTREELEHIGDISLRHHVFVIADEIHCELVFNGHTYTPFASIKEEFLMNSATCTSPSKAFNIAGLQIANITVANQEAREQIDKALNINEVCDVNPFGVIALQEAYNHGEEWLDALLAYLYDNYLYLCNFFKRELPHLPVIQLEGTYLVWIDCSALGESSQRLAANLLKQHHVWLNKGMMYGEDGDSFMRINIACPRQTLSKALHRIKDAWSK